MTSNSTMSNSSFAVDLNFFFYTQLATGICLAILSPLTIVSNALLLLTIFKDPLRCFRTPATYFIVALAIVDLATGVLVEPFFVLYRFVSYSTWSLIIGEPYYTFQEIGIWLSYVGLNASFLLVLGLISTQYLAITYPHLYRSIVTTRRVLACVVSCVGYFTGFILLQFVVSPQLTLFQVDLHLHSTLITILLIVGSAMLLRSFRQFAKTSRRLAGGNSIEQRTIRGRGNKPQTNKISERQFTIVTLFLAGILIVCALPHIITLHIRFYTKIETRQEWLDLYAVITIGDEMMFVKVALDAFIYAWRLKKYRRSLKMALSCGTNIVESEIIVVRTMDNFTFQQANPETSSTQATGFGAN